MTEEKHDELTTNFGAPVPNNQDPVTAGKRGPMLMQDVWYLEKMADFVRFSTVAGERGAADAERDIRGFAVEMYTDEGNWDLVGNMKADPAYGEGVAAALRIATSKVGA